MRPWGSEFNLHYYKNHIIFDELLATYPRIKQFFQDHPNFFRFEEPLMVLNDLMCCGALDLKNQNRDAENHVVDLLNQGVNNPYVICAVFNVFHVLGNHNAFTLRNVEKLLKIENAEAVTYAANLLLDWYKRSFLTPSSLNYFYDLALSFGELIAGIKEYLLSVYVTEMKIPVSHWFGIFALARYGNEALMLFVLVLREYQNFGFFSEADIDNCFKILSERMVDDDKQLVVERLNNWLSELSDLYGLGLTESDRLKFIEKKKYVLLLKTKMNMTLSMIHKKYFTLLDHLNGKNFFLLLILMQRGVTNEKIITHLFNIPILKFLETVYDNLFLMRLSKTNTYQNDEHIKIIGLTPEGLVTARLIGRKSLFLFESAVLFAQSELNALGKTLFRLEDLYKDNCLLNALCSQATHLTTSPDKDWICGFLKDFNQRIVTFEIFGFKDDVRKKIDEDKVGFYKICEKMRVSRFIQFTPEQQLCFLEIGANPARFLIDLYHCYFEKTPGIPFETQNSLFFNMINPQIMTMIREFDKTYQLMKMNFHFHVFFDAVYQRFSQFLIRAENRVENMDLFWQKELSETNEGRNKARLLFFKIPAVTTQQISRRDQATQRTLE